MVRAKLPITDYPLMLCRQMPILLKSFRKVLTQMIEHVVVVVVPVVLLISHKGAFDVGKGTTT